MSIDVPKVFVRGSCHAFRERDMGKSESSDFGYPCRKQTRVESFSARTPTSALNRGGFFLYQIPGCMSLVRVNKIKALFTKSSQAGDHGRRIKAVGGAGKLTELKISAPQVPSATTSHSPFGVRGAGGCAFVLLSLDSWLRLHSALARSTAVGN